MGKLIEAVRKLGTKMTGKQTVESNSLVKVINDIADDYEGGGGGTSYTAGNGISISDNTINADLKVLEVSNITSLTTAQCNALKVGDVVVKITSNQKHTYTVSYKEDGVGMCLTYTDASTSETVSYDYVTNAWVYNSTDITPLKNVVANPELVGTESDLTGIQIGDTKYKVPEGGSGGDPYSFAFSEFAYYVNGKVLDVDEFVALWDELSVALDDANYTDINFIIPDFLDGAPAVLYILGFINDSTTFLTVCDNYIYEITESSSADIKAELIANKAEIESYVIAGYNEYGYENTMLGYPIMLQPVFSYSFRDNGIVSYQTKITYERLKSLFKEPAQSNE